MNKLLSSTGALLLLVGSMTQVQAGVILYKPTTIAASSIDGDAAPNSTYGVDRLVDNYVTEADIGTVPISLGDGSSYASYGWREESPAVIMGFDEVLTFDSIVYAQRKGGTDMISSIDLWFSSTPYLLANPTWTTVNPSGTPDESLAIVTESDPYFRKYDFASAHAGQYIFARLYNSLGAGWYLGANNPGGSEIRLGGTTVIPEPSTVMLLTGSVLGLLGQGWRKRK